MKVNLSQKRLCHSLLGRLIQDIVIMTTTNLIAVEQLNQCVVEHIRGRVMSKLNEEPDKYHPNDVKKFKERSELIYRFLIDFIEDNGGLTAQDSANCPEKVTKAILETLNWRLTFGVNSSQDSDFPQEFYRLNLFRISKRVDGSIFLFISIRKLIRLRQWNNVYIRFIIHEMDKICEIMFTDPDFFKKVKPHVLSDASEIGLGQIDFSFVFTMIPIFINHYPQAFTTIWLYELPYFSLHLKTIVMKTLPHRVTKKITFTDKKRIVNDIGAENLPEEYCGTSTEPLTELTSTSASTLREVGRKNGISDKEIDKMIASLTF